MPTSQARRRVVSRHASIWSFRELMPYPLQELLKRRGPRAKVASQRARTRNRNGPNRIGAVGAIA
jgi:hypothetical protein